MVFLGSSIHRARIRTVGHSPGSVSRSSHRSSLRVSDAVNAEDIILPGVPNLFLHVDEIVALGYLVGANGAKTRFDVANRHLKLLNVLNKHYLAQKIFFTVIQ